jgi:hypothetical protein
LAGSRTSKELSRNTASSAADVLVTINSVSDSYDEHHKDDVNPSGGENEVDGRTSIQQKHEPQTLTPHLPQQSPRLPSESTPKAKRKGKGKSSEKSNNAHDRECAVM